VTRKRVVLYVSIAAVFVLLSGFAWSRRGQAGAVPDTVVLRGELEGSTGASLVEWGDVGALPALPLASVAVVSAGSTLTIPAIPGLSGVAAILDGTPLQVDRQESSFVIKVKTIDGTGPAELIVVESFQGGTISLPITVYVGATQAVGVNSDSDNIAGASLSRQLTVPWSELGFTPAHESDAIGPQAIALDRDGRLIVLDTVNSRVVTVNDQAELETLIKLPSQTFTNIAVSDSGDLVYALDPLHAQGVDVLTGRAFTLSPVVMRFPLGLKYTVDDEGTIFVQNPADGAGYSIGSSSQATADSTRSLDWTRVVMLNDNTALIQPTVLDAPLALTFPEAKAIGVTGASRLDNGKIVMLTSLLIGDTPTTELVIIDHGNARTVPISFEGAVSMTTNMASDGRSVTIAYPTKNGLVITTYDVEA